jgi:RNA polymerase sigma-70 factor (ECF subfamily)
MFVIAALGAPSMLNSVRRSHADRRAAASEELADQVRAARRGDRTAFASLYRDFAPLVHGILLVSVPPAEAEDLAHDVFLRAMRKLGTLRDPGSFGPWISTLARHAATDFHRRRRGTEPLADDLPAPPSGPDADAAAARRAATQALAAIRALPDAYRETLILRLVEGLTGPQIAERTGMTPGSVRVNLHRGMKLLRRHLDRADAAASETRR